MANITASIVVNFGSDADSGGTLEAELDGILNVGLNGEEKTSFAATDTAFFIVYKSANVTLAGKPVPSSGMVQGGGTVVRTITEQLEFVTPDSEVTISKTPSGSVTFSPWYGNNDSAPVLTGRVVTIGAASYPAIVDVEYQAEGISYELVPPVIDTATYPEWPILVVVTGSVEG